MGFGSDCLGSSGVSSQGQGIRRLLSGKPIFHKSHYKKTATMKVAAITSETHTLISMSMPFLPILGTFHWKILVQSSKLALQ